MLKIATALLMLIVSSSLRPLYAADLDVTGIKLGMSITAARALIGSGFKFEHDKSQDPHVDMYKGVSSDGNEGYLLLTLDDRLFYVGHVQSYRDAAQAPNRDALQAAMVAKYGPPTERDEISSSQIWMRDAAGNLITRQTPHYDVFSMRCSPSAALTMGTVRVGNNSLAYPIAFPPVCNVAMRSEIGVMANPALVSYYDVVLWDYQPMFHHLKAQQDAAKLAAARAAAAAKKNTPHL
jgi:hypothetical protein